MRSLRWALNFRVSASASAIAKARFWPLNELRIRPPMESPVRAQTASVNAWAFLSAARVRAFFQPSYCEAQAVKSLCHVFASAFVSVAVGSGGAQTATQIGRAHV